MQKKTALSGSTSPRDESDDAGGPGGDLEVLSQQVVCLEAPEL